MALSIMNRLGIILGIAALHFGGALASADTCEALKNTLSPDGRIAIRKTNNGDFEFFDVSSQRGLGLILRPEGLRNVSFVASWNSDESDVALLMYYGTKLSTLMIFQRTDSGTLVRRDFEMTDPIKLFQKKHGSRPFAKNESGPMDNHVGPWIAKNTIRLIAGESREAFKDPPPQKEYLFASFEATISKGCVSIGNVNLHEMMTFDEANQLLSELGIVR